MRHAVGLMDPQGLRVKAFKAPTPEEKRRGFLWRVRQARPVPGEVGVFDRCGTRTCWSARVRQLTTAATIERRYDAINDFEAKLVGSGCDVIKVLLHISKDEQKARLMAGSTIRPSIGSTTHATWMSALFGTTTNVPTRLPSSGATPTPRRGTSCQQTESGTATGR